MMIHSRSRRHIASVLVTLLTATSSHAEELARIPAHSQRYGTHTRISAYDDPLLKGVTCFISGPVSGSDGRDLHDRNSGGAATSVSCHQVGPLPITVRVPQQAQVFDESTDPAFRSIHIIRILDMRRLVVLYFSFTKSDLAGDLPGHVDVVRLPAISSKQDTAGK
ncbi:CreA family protein [Burkholderia contaminans]|uniref:CreA family protein n=2 Tax=Burkholderia contaminans TaxID=488447 RepID=UPI0035DBA88E